MLRNVELRKLPTGSLSSIIDIMETNDDWKQVLSNVPEDPTSENFKPKFNNEHIRLIESHAKQTGRKCSEILLDEWSTFGLKRPTLDTLKNVLIRAQIYRAADEVAIMLQEAPPIRPNIGPAAAVDTNVTMLLQNESVDNILNGMATIQDLSDIKINTIFNNNLNKSITHPPMSSKAYEHIMKLLNHKISTVGSDLIKFTKDTVTEETENIPNFNALMSQTENSSKHTTSNSLGLPIISVLASDSDQTQSKEWISTQSSNHDNYIPSSNHNSDSNAYQMSFPNINLSQNQEIHRIDSTILHDTNLYHFTYQELQNITNNFSDEPVNHVRMTGKIGSGGFGDVYMGHHSRFGALAIKKARERTSAHRPDIMLTVFNAEVKNLSQYRHPNIVPILGFSKDGPALCIVCEYVNGGSLREKLREKVLNEQQRISIMMGTAEGLKYLHRGAAKSLIHGDVKSDNILLTKEYIPKLCDFGLAKQFDSTFITTAPMGTSAYMAPEGFSGTISEKIDIYSYGIVLLELLTGLQPIIVNDKEMINIKTYVEENCEDNDAIDPILDPVIKNWTKANEIFNLAIACLEKHRKKRIAIEDVCQQLYRIAGQKVSRVDGHCCSQILTTPEEPPVHCQPLERI
ncbi:Interleukin-1 receptor-associated kinase 4 [Eumeta japonica]|uniref:Interleukin-1 receptor-associated kinase 4 n=1 Tax=Eumeta variegata TaxID=151549 RepID=A0A4C1WBZ2_EUMVA|nr:Interleukin-1 receptor-associated kinase 4 [Eumeta japonica]